MIQGSQSFILSDTLPFCVESVCDTSTIAQGIEISFIPGPLYHVSRRFMVAIRSSLPVQGIDFIMGNDSAGCKVMPVDNTPFIDQLMCSHKTFQVCPLLVQLQHALG